MLVRDQAAQWAEATNATFEPLLSDTWRQEYERIAARRQGADLAELFGSATHIHADRLVDVSDIAEEVAATHGPWFDFARRFSVVDGVWRAIPWLYTPHGLNYREDILVEAGLNVPKTYDDLLDVATSLRDAGLPEVGFSMGPKAPNDSASMAYSMLWSFGGQEVDDTGSRVVLDSDATRAALKYFMALSEVSSSLAPQFDELTNNTAFLESQISMTQNATSIYWNASQDKRDLAAVMNHARYPEGPAGTHQLAEINLIAIFNHTRNEAAAKDWIRFMMQGDQRRSKSIESSLFFAPPLAKFSDDPQMPWNTEQKFAGFRSSADAVRGPGWPGPASVEGSLVYANGSILRMFQAVGNGTMTVNEAISAASNELRRVYET